jgi:hypothetical protein
MFEALFLHYFSMVYAQGSADMKSDWIALDSKLREVTQAQSALEAQAAVIAQRQQTIDEQGEKAIATLKARQAKGKAMIADERAKLRRIQSNERFAKYLDNACWTINRFGKGTAKGFGRWISWAIDEVNWQSGRFSVLIAVALVHWLVFFPLLGAWGLRIALSDRCLEIRLCQAALRWAIMSNAENHRSK